jgi:hypothetical protein
MNKKQGVATFGDCEPKSSSLRAFLENYFHVLVLAPLGLYGSIKVVVGIFGFEADTSHSLILWHGVTQHGLSWLRDWIFTQDNWLLSLIPFHFLGFAVFGEKLSLVIIFGWLIFILSAIVGAMIVKSAGYKNCSFFVLVVLLNLGLYAHVNGFVSYSTSHNISNLYGLLALFLLMKWCRHPNNIKLVLMSLLLILGSVSDPWMLAAYDLPLLLASACIYVRPIVNIDRGRALKLFFSAAFSVLSVKTHLFGVLYFLPSVQFRVGSWSSINANAIYLVKDFGGLLNIFPYGGGNEFLPAVLSIVVFVCLICMCLLRMAKGDVTVSGNVRILLLFSLFSVGGILASFLLSDVPAQDYSGRYLINCLYISVIMAAVLLGSIWSCVDLRLKLFSLSVYAFFVFSGIVSILPLMLKPGFSFKDTGNSSLISFLKDNGLRYGYGPYWGANANAVTVESKHKIIIRPVIFNAASGEIEIGTRVQSSKKWAFDDDEMPRSEHQFFVLIRSDGEECPNVELCMSGVKRQFGNPVKILKKDDSTILVWRRDLNNAKGL